MKKPNIIFILSDDLSYRDIGCYGQEIIKTPNIDKIADDGMRFTQCYSGSTVCAPSRCALMTGKHMGHARVRENFIRAKGATRYIDSLKAEDTTVAEVLKKAGYTTGIAGKWALGAANSEGMPSKKGFDYSFGFIDQTQAHTYYPNLVFENDRLVRIPENEGYDMTKVYELMTNRFDEGKDKTIYDENGTYSPDGIKDPSKAKNMHDLMSEAAYKFIDRNHESPFFLYVAYTVPHGPIVTPSLEPYTNEDFPSTRHKVWAAMISRMDSDIGKMMEQLEHYGIAEDTIIIFASDNGYSAHAYFGQEKGEEVEFFKNRGPFTGYKGNLYEGGIRVPFIMSWPGVIKPGRTCDQTFSFYDILPTFADITGVQAPDNIDGISILPTITGESIQEQHEYFYWEYGHEQAVRYGKYKAHRNHPSEPIELYDLEVDQLEHNDIAKDHPDIVEKITEFIKESHVDSEVWLNPGESEEYVLAKTAHLEQNRFKCMDPNYIKWIRSLGYDENFDFFGLN
ncbi:arylsulfatase [Vallitalea okinawensis]|uniref:arylsulfatase n=1 Tax=Vallitalea okinawensis TaxID=2078660 RepID=UPI00130072EC|nr:arylsulfatase [Vallitalea okinawensis]